MSPNNVEQFLPIVAGIFVVLGLGNAFFFASKNAHLKRKAWPPFLIATAVVFFGGAWAAGAPAEALLFLVPLLSVSTFLGLRSTRFCDACGKTTMSQTPFSPPTICNKCGSTLQP